MEISEKDNELVMKLLHYFITEQEYSPVILHGAQNEIWLENFSSDYKIVRIVTNYIHNNEQLNFDIFKTRQIAKKIKSKTFSFSINVMSIFLNLGDNVVLENGEMINKNISCVSLKDIKDLEKHKLIIDAFPDIAKETNFKEQGMELFVKITSEIGMKNETESKKAEEVFKEKKPVVTYGLIAINVIIFVLMYILGYGSTNVATLIRFGAQYKPLVLNGEYYRLLTSAFLHIGIIHLLCNMYSLYIIGSQVENFYGKAKYIVIYLFSAFTGSLLSLLFVDTISAGASGAIFGLLGSILYFGYHYRVYLGTVIKSQIIPIIFLNLLIGYLTPGINNFAHVGGLIGGILISKAVGVKYKSSKSDIINGIIMTIILTMFLIYMAFFK
jgi:rhomboid protease GluP